MRSTCAYLLSSFLLLLWSSSSASQPHLEKAVTYLGHVEHGNNRSVLIDRWNRAVGAPVGSPWCASYVAHCLTSGGARDPRARTAWSRGYITSTSIPASRILTGAYRVRKGDILIWRRSATQGHIGFALEDWNGAKGKTIEGNTSSGQVGSQWNGNGVYTRFRVVSPYNHFRITHVTPVRY